MSDALGLSVVAKSEDYAARVVDVRLSSARHVTTPCRALYLGAGVDSEARFVGFGSGGGVVELCRPMWQTTINRIDSDNGAQRDFMNRLLPVALQKELENCLILLVLRLVEGRQERPWLPNEREVKYLADLLASFPTTTIIPPVVEGFSIDEQIVYLKRFMHRARSNSTKPLMGMIPYLDSWRDQERLQQFYLREGLTSYVWDLHGHTPSALAPNLRSIVAHLGVVEREHGPQFAHAMNVKYSQERRSKTDATGAGRTDALRGLRLIWGVARSASYATGGAPKTRGESNASDDQALRQEDLRVRCCRAGLVADNTEGSAQGSRASRSYR